MKIIGFLFPAISFCSTMRNKSCRQWGTHCGESSTFPQELGAASGSESVMLSPGLPGQSNSELASSGQLEFSVAQRVTHTGPGLGQLLAAPHINIMILFYQSTTRLWDFICIPLMISLYTTLSPLFYLSLVNWVLWY